MTNTQKQITLLVSVIGEPCAKTAEPIDMRRKRPRYEDVARYV